MPIPPAHPAAILPLRRLCPKVLDLPALVIGSIVPDFAYAIDDINKFSHTAVAILGNYVANSEWVLNDWDWDDFSHTITGSLLFGMPVGLAAWGIVIALRVGLVSQLPNPHRDALLELCRRKRSSLITCAVSLFIGIATHLLWDSFTNGDRWLGRHWNFLHLELVRLGSKPLLVYRFFWFISSIGGVLATTLAYVAYIKKRRTNSSSSNDVKKYRLWGAVILISAIIAYTITQHFARLSENPFEYLHRFLGIFLAAMGCAVFVVALWARVRRPSSPT